MERFISHVVKVVCVRLVKKYDKFQVFAIASFDMYFIFLDIF